MVIAPLLLTATSLHSVPFLSSIEAPEASVNKCWLYHIPWPFIFILILFKVMYNGDGQKSPRVSQVEEAGSNWLYAWGLLPTDTVHASRTCNIFFSLVGARFGCICALIAGHPVGLLWYLTVVSPGCYTNVLMHIYVWLVLDTCGWLPDIFIMGLGHFVVFNPWFK